MACPFGAPQFPKTGVFGSRGAMDKCTYCAGGPEETFSKEDITYEAFKIKFCDLLGSLPDLSNLKNTDFKEFDQNLTSTLEVLNNDRFENIQRLQLNKQQKEILKKTTDNFLELAS